MSHLHELHVWTKITLFLNMTIINALVYMTIYIYIYTYILNDYERLRDSKQIVLL
jgi:hypothetical protein